MNKKQKEESRGEGLRNLEGEEGDITTEDEMRNYCKKEEKRKRGEGKRVTGFLKNERKRQKKRTGSQNEEEQYREIQGEKRAERKTRREERDG